VRPSPTRTPTREQVVEVCGQRLRVLLDSPERTPSRSVVLLGGIGARADLLGRLVEALDPQYEYIRIDPPGIGGSPTYGFPYLIPQIAWLVGATLRKLGRSKYHLIGFSWGGLVAQQLALQARSRVDRLVLVSTNTGVVSVPGNPISMAMVMNPLGSEALARGDGPPLGKVLGGIARTRPAEVMAVLGPDLAAAGSGYVQQLFASMSWTTLPMLPLIRNETLVIGGEDDPLVPLVNAKIIASAIRRSRLHIHSGGHFDPLLEPQLVAPAIQSFLNE
jgi:pimeloyl-ACP methyl ester carboxylesterase